MSYFNVYTPNHVAVFYQIVLDLAEIDFIDLTEEAQQVFPFLKTGDEQTEENEEEDGRLLYYTIGSSSEADEENRAEIL
jgi:hypothetical protein